MSDLYNLLADNEPTTTLYGGVSNTEFDPMNEAAVDVMWEYAPWFPLANKMQKGYKTYKRINRLSELKNKRKIWGIPFRKGNSSVQKAIDTLKEQQQGFVPNVNNSGIDFVWGKYNPPTNSQTKGNGFGLAHIIGRRNEQGYNGEAFLNKIPRLFDEGIRYNKPGHTDRYYMGDDNIEAIIRKDYDGNPWQWLNSVYYLDKK